MIPIEYYESIDEHNPNKKRKILMVHDDIFADILNTKRLFPILKE